MSLVVQFEIRCDICQRRFSPSFESVANRAGITKASGAAEARQEAKQRGWERRRCPDRPYRPQIDVCPACIGDPAPDPLWFQAEDRTAHDGS